MILNGPPAGLSGVLQEWKSPDCKVNEDGFVIIAAGEEEKNLPTNAFESICVFLAIQKCTIIQGTIEPGYTSITAVESQRRVINQAFRNSHKKSPKTGPQDVIGSKDKTRQKANQDGGNCTCFAVTLFTNDFSFITARLLLWQTVKHTRSLIDLRFIHLY